MRCDQWRKFRTEYCKINSTWNLKWTNKMQRMNEEEEKTKTTTATTNTTTNKNQYNGEQVKLLVNILYLHTFKVVHLAVLIVALICSMHWRCHRFRFRFASVFFFLFAALRLYILFRRCRPFRLQLIFLVPFHPIPLFHHSSGCIRRLAIVVVVVVYLLHDHCTLFVLNQQSKWQIWNILRDKKNNWTFVYNTNRTKLLFCFFFFSCLFCVCVYVWRWWEFPNGKNKNSYSNTKNLSNGLKCVYIHLCDVAFLLCCSKVIFVWFYVFFCTRFHEFIWMVMLFYDLYSFVTMWCLLLLMDQIYLIITHNLTAWIGTTAFQE